MNQVNQTSTDTPQNGSEEDYDLIEKALIQNPRGRWFLEEYLKRNRPEDTQKLLGAIQRIENTLQQKSAPAAEDIDPIRMSIIEMSKAIAKTREEINSIKPDDDSDNQLISATEELSAIVESTESATNTILEAAEEIQEAGWTMREAGADGECCDKIDEKTTEIYTACSFQDITGQRTTKVVQALCYIENRVNAMIDIWGLHEFSGDAGPIQETTDTRPDAHLLNGPAKMGEGIEQDSVDDMMSEGASQDIDMSASGQDLADNISFDQVDPDGDTALDVDAMSFDAIAPDDDVMDLDVVVSGEVVCEPTDPAQTLETEALNPLEGMVDEMDSEIEAADLEAIESEAVPALETGDLDSAAAAAPTNDPALDHDLETAAAPEEGPVDFDMDVEAHAASSDVVDDLAFNEGMMDVSEQTMAVAEDTTAIDSAVADAMGMVDETDLADMKVGGDFQDTLQEIEDVVAGEPDPELASFAENVLSDSPSPVVEPQETSAMEQQDMSVPTAGESILPETALDDVETLDPEALTDEQKDTLLG